MDELVVQGEISGRIFTLRGKEIMLDRDLAALYKVETKVLNQAMKRNIKRFPSDFMFQLSQEEFENWRSQNVTSNSDKMGLRIPPFAFTEQGVAMLSSILNSKKAIQVNIQIMRVFTRIRELLLDNLNVKLEIEDIKKKLENHNKNIELVFSYLDELIEKQDNPEPRPRVGYIRNSESD